MALDHLLLDGPEPLETSIPALQEVLLVMGQFLLLLQQRGLPGLLLDNLPTQTHFSDRSLIDVANSCDVVMEYLLASVSAAFLLAHLLLEVINGHQLALATVLSSHLVFPPPSSYQIEESV